MGRIEDDPRITLAPCTRSGQPAGLTVGGLARRLEGEEAERILRGSGLWRRLWLWILAYKLMAPRNRWVPYEVSPLAGERTEED